MYQNCTYEISKNNYHLIVGFHNVLKEKYKRLACFFNINKRYNYLQKSKSAKHHLHNTDGQSPV